jgi:hypothetical protein
MFYHFDVEGQSTTFVDIMDHPLIIKERSMYIIESTLALQRGNHHVHPVTTNSTIYHIDAITSKVLLVPHYSHLLKDTQMCAIRMWEAR